MNVFALASNFKCLSGDLKFLRNGWYWDGGRGGLLDADRGEASSPDAHRVLGGHVASRYRLL